MRFPVFPQLMLVSSICAMLVPAWSTIALASPYHDAFTNRVANPGDLDVLSDFITIAVDSGQYDQALSTIEQHLISHPRDAQARLISGRLYNHVGSYDLAKRQLEHALSIGTLEPEERAEAEKLLDRIEKGIAGNSGFVSLTIGGDIVRQDFSSAAAVADRTDFNPYGEIYGTLRHSLDTPSDDAIVLTARARVSRRFGDVNLSGAGGVFTALSGRGALTFDKGLPNSGISSLRLALTAYGDYSTFQKDDAIQEYGVLAKFTARPSVDTTVFAQFGYANLGASDMLFTDHRYRAAIGGAHRISGKHAVGAAVRSQFDYTNGGTFVGKSIEGQVSYAGLLWSAPKGPVWTHRVSLAGGRVDVPDLAATPGTTFDGNFWALKWDHSYEIDERNRVDFNTFYQRYSFDNSTRDQSSYGVGLSYTYTFR